MSLAPFSGFRIRFQRFEELAAVNPGNNSVICELIPGSHNIAFASALVVDDTMFVFGTNNDPMNDTRTSKMGKSRTQVHTLT